MSLKHWWPLINDFQDKVGGNHLQIPTAQNNDHITLNSNGKFGTCYGKATTGKADLLRSINKIGPFAEESICGWFLVTEHAATGTANGLITHHNHATNSGLGIGVFTTDGSQYFTSINAGTGSDRIHSSATYRGKTNIKGSWHHICLTYSADKKLRMYVDGKEDMDATSYSLYNTSDYFDLFNWSTGYYDVANYRPATKMTDIRVYDHALSPAEVQELAKGLALHYNFNQIYSKNICNWRDASTCLQGGWTGSAVYENDILTLTATNGWRSFMWDIGDENVGKPITFSYEYKIINSDNVDFITTQHHPSSYWGSAVGGNLDLTKIGWTKKTVVISNPKKCVGIMLRGTDDTGKSLVLQVRNVKIALNDYDDIYSEYNINSQCADDSGYYHNGTCYSITPTLDSKRGERTVSLDGMNSYIESPNFKSNLPNEDYTFAFWIKPSENGVRDIIYGNHAGSSHSFNIERYTSNQLRIYYNDNTPGYISEVTMPANEWTHIAIVRKGNVIQVWKNGEKKSEKAYTLTTLNCNNANYLLGADYRTSYTTDGTRFKGLLDDFRIYVTALNESAIKDLYEPAIYMTNNDAFMAEEFIEENEIEMTSKSTVSAMNIYEEIINGYEQLEYLQSSGTQYINTDFIPNQDSGIEITYMFTSNANSHCSLFGAGAAYNDRAFEMYGWNNVYQSNYGNNPVYLGSEVTTNIKNHIKHYKTSTIIENGGYTYSSNHTSNTFTSPCAMILFGLNRSGSPSCCSSPVRIYHCRIFDNNIMIRNFIPMRRTSDGTLGMYDTVQKKFYINSGKGTFIAGPTVSNNKISMYASNTISAKEFIEF